MNLAIAVPAFQSRLPRLFFFFLAIFFISRTKFLLTLFFHLRSRSSGHPAPLRRNRHVWRSIPDRTWPFTLPCLAHANRVRGATRRWAAASLAVSQIGVCGTSGILETTGTAVELFNRFDCAGHYSLCGCLTPARDSQCVGRLSPDLEGSYRAFTQKPHQLPRTQNPKAV
jgi:hypothetical protein